MRKDSSLELDSSSSCSASSAGDTPECQQPDSLSSVDDAEDTADSATDSVVPTARAFSTSSRAKAKAHVATIKASSAGASKAKSARRSQKEQLSKEEEERRRIRRERNKIAAAKCRNRRRELIDTLQAETDQLEDEKMTLQTEISDLLKEKEQLELALASHTPCKLSVTVSSEDIPEVCPGSPQLMAMLDNVKTSEDMDSEPCNNDAAILGNSNILLSSHAQEQTLHSLEADDLDDLVPSLEMEVMTETTASVPDIDMGTPFCLPDWETLYKSVASDFESLSTPIMSSSPTCSNYRSVFTFNYSEIASMTEGSESLKGAASDFTKDLHSPTLLAL